MTSLYSSEYSIVSRRGGRISSPRLRALIQMSKDFCGLEDNINRYDLLVLVKRAGKEAGFTSKMVELLDYYLAFTKDIDWEQGSRPIVYQSLSKTAMDLGVSERQIQNLEKALFELDTITWCDSGNHKRYGKRCPDSGTIVFAYGVDLSPLAYKQKELQDVVHEKQLYQQAWLECKRQISYYRAQIRACLAEASDQGRGLIKPSDIQEYQKAYEKVAVQIRSHMGISVLRELISKHKALHTELLDNLDNEGTMSEEEKAKTQKTSCRNEINFTHKESYIYQPSNELESSSSSINGFEGYSIRSKELKKVSSKQTEIQKPSKSKEELILDTGLQHISIKHALIAASDEFKAHIPIQNRSTNWNDMVQAAHKRKSEINISQKSWGDACFTLTRAGAAVCVLLTDRAMKREKNPVRKPGAYFNAMIRRVGEGKLNLHKSILGLIRQDD